MNPPYTIRSVLADRLGDKAAQAIEAIGVATLLRARKVKSFAAFYVELLRLTVRPPFRTELVFEQLEFVGNQSMLIILLTGFFTGAVFGLQIGAIFGIFKAEGLMGAATGKAMAKELAPLLTGMLLAGRAGSSMTAEIATMRVNEQIDAMEAMGTDPNAYLAVPRMVATTLIIPFLAALFMFSGVIGAFLVGIFVFNVDQAVFFEKIRWLVLNGDIGSGLFKAAVFGTVIGTVACKYGLDAKGGAKGVGVATTDSVVTALLAILTIDVVITYFQVAW